MEDDKCCFCIPIVPGMKALSVFIVLANITDMIKLFANWETTALMVILALLELALSGVICYGLAKWFLDSS